MKNKHQKNCTIHSVVCCYCLKDIKSTPIELSGQLMHYYCANKAYIERCGDDGCITHKELQEFIP